MTMSDQSSSKNQSEDISKALQVLSSVGLLTFLRTILHKIQSWLLSEKLYRRLAVTICTTTLGLWTQTYFWTRYGFSSLPVGVGASSVMVLLWGLVVFKEKTKGKLSITSPTEQK